jgi:hypothetical protein
MNLRDGKCKCTAKAVEANDDALLRKRAEEILPEHGGEHTQPSEHCSNHSRILKPRGIAWRRLYRMAMQGEKLSDDTLATYPYIVVRLACRFCKRRGQYRLARLAAKFGAETEMRNLLEHLAKDCEYWRPRHPYHIGCGAFFCDIGTGKPPTEFAAGYCAF